MPGFGLKVDIAVTGLADVQTKDELVAAAHEVRPPINSLSNVLTAGAQFCPYSRAFKHGIEATAKAV